MFSTADMADEWDEDEVVSTFITLLEFFFFFI